MGELQAVIFDMDGVLIDARDWHFEALNEALGMFGFTITQEEHLGRFDGLPTRDKLNLLSESKGLPRSIHTLINAVKQERTLRIAAQKCYPQAHHLILMAALKRRGLKIGLATNSVRATTEAMLTAAGLIGFFDVIVTNQDVSHAKPHPEIYNSAMAKLNVTPEHTLVVEDNPHGVAAATASGALVCRVQDPSEVHVEKLSAYFQGGLV
jgi:HAD superfamily hydrolase (TIGR01509 family)